jgi:hypothetical protein
MKNLNSYIKKLNIIKFSRISSTITISAIALAILAQTYLFVEVKYLVDKKVNMEKGYEALHEFKYQTEFFLTSHDLEENKKNLNKAYENYLKGFEILTKTISMNDSLLNYHEIVKIKYEEIYNIVFKNEHFSEKKFNEQIYFTKIR